MESALLAQINADLKDSLLKRDAEKTGVLRFVISVIRNREIEKRGTGQAPVLTDEEVVDILQREVKKRREAIELFKKGNRVDLADKETKELTHITGYLPAEMTREEVTALVAELKSKGLADFNSLIKEAAKATKGRADGKMVSEVVREAVK